jgi:hypothetical protein
MRQVLNYLVSYPRADCSNDEGMRKLSKHEGHGATPARSIHTGTYSAFVDYRFMAHVY